MIYLTKADVISYILKSLSSGQTMKCLTNAVKHTIIWKSFDEYIRYFHASILSVWEWNVKLHDIDLKFILR